jgi:mRNA interferase RelE/StbE
MPRAILSRGAQRDLGRLDRVVAARIVRAIERYAATGHGDVKRLQGRGDEMRLRVGDWRVIFTFEDDGETILIGRILPRGRVYRD